MSVFLERSPEEWVAENQWAFAIRDGFPVTLGHTLVITREVVPTWFDASPEQQRGVMALIDEVKAALDDEYAPDGFNVGFNAGEAAGQTVPHLHVHVIPRYRGDVDDPRGGVRYVLPNRANYKTVDADWKKPPGRESGGERPAPGLTTGEGRLQLLGYVERLFARASEATLVLAFVRASGLELIHRAVEDFLREGGRLRLLTGDYLDITQADALQRLLDLQSRTRAYAGSDEALGSDAERLRGHFEVAVVETERLQRAFHPKAWIFGWGKGGAAYVGSSNLSRSALTRGVEWNLRLESHRDPSTWRALNEATDHLWRQGRPLDAEWVARYRERARRGARPLPPGEVEAEVPAVPAPRDVQVEALEALKASRAAGEGRALVVLATGLGKTFLAAFDVAAFAEERGRRPRVLVLAHRRELLTQATETFRCVLPDARFTWCLGSEADLGGDVVFASVQKLSRPELLAQVPAGHFDYVVVDEVHHATARSYRRILDALEPTFLLGLTATPDRADEADVLGLFDDHLPYRADLAVGISRRLLVPFAYQGLRDQVDYAPIPWRSGRFDAKALSTALQTQARMESLWAAWQRLPGTRTLIFCASIDHARFVREWLSQRGVRVEAVHSKKDSYGRAEGLRELAAGQLDALCTVDLFNEGIDCKPVDRVVMLRPTESPVIFLQQLGRGLRIAPEKTRLQVIDFVGNHRVFLDRIRTLLDLGPRGAPVRAWLEGKATPELPPGCSVDVELEAKDLLLQLLPKSSGNELVRVYRELLAVRGQRPKAGELLRLGYNPASVREPHGSWVGFVAEEGDLATAESRAFAEHERWLAHLGRTNMTKCFKMVVLEALIEAERFAEGLPLDELARRCHAYLRRSPELLADLEGVKALDDPRDPDPEAWLAYWRKNPIAAWTRAGKGGRAWFELREETFRPAFRWPDDPETAGGLVRLTEELVDWRLAQYRQRRRAVTDETGPGRVTRFRMKVLTNKRDPILWFDSRSERALLPMGETDVRLPEGDIWRFRFAKIACNVARPIADQRNRLPDLLRRWFGPDAGRPGTERHVELVRAPEGWWIKPIGGNVLAFPVRGEVVAYPSLRAAAGTVLDGPRQGEAIETEAVRLPVEPGVEQCFAVRATGDSMDGGAAPIRHGDWMLMRWARGAGFGQVAGRIALVALGEADEGRQFLVKRVVRSGNQLRLRSENRDFGERAPDGSTQVIALLDRVVRPEDLAPGIGEVIAGEELASAFGLDAAPKPPWSRRQGHLFRFISGPEQLREPDRLAPAGENPRPGETAFVLAGEDGGRWRYCGVARRRENESDWTLPAVDHATWRRHGHGRSSSRRLDPRYLQQAEQIAAALAVRAGEWFGAGHRRCRVVGRARQGGVRIDGGPEGFAERTVSLLDLGWVVAARDECPPGALVDEARVNRLRYLEGTPKSSTRWIDTGWALRLTASPPT